MKNSYLCLIFLYIFMHHEQLLSDNRIILYLQHAPESIIQQAEQEAQKSKIAGSVNEFEKKSPGDASQSMVQNSLRSFAKPALSGIVAIYGGYMDISDPDGLISFPLRHVSQKVYVAITSQIKMINIKGETYAHREYYFEEKNPIQIFSFIRGKDAKGLSFWDVKEEKIPDDKKINPLTIVLLTNPSNIVVSQGSFMATENIQLILPQVLNVVNRESTPASLLNSLDIRRYFEPVTFDQKKATDVSLQKMINNL
jgi:hypothetical protein